MPVWPKPIITFGASLLTTRTAIRLRGRDRGVRHQHRAFNSVIRQLAQTAFWREAGVTAGMDYATFRTRVAPRGYSAFEPAIERMRGGEADVLWPGPCVLFVSSSGTTGECKLLPVTAEMLHHFRIGCRNALLYYTARTGHVGVLRGRHLFLTGSTAMKPLAGSALRPAFVGEWPAVAALNLPNWALARLFEPGTEIADMEDWQAKIEAVILRTSDRDISLIAGVPTWVLQFAETVRSKRAAAGQPLANLQGLWPNLECFVHGGTLIAPYQAELRAALGPTVQFHDIYGAAEGIIAAQDTANGPLRLMPDLGLFFEFVPLASYDEQRLEQLGEKAVSLGEIQPEIDYVLLVTSPAGVARYVTGDIVRFASTEPPRLHFVGRTSLQLDAFAEHVTERETTEALLVVCQRHRWTIVNFHVAPLFAANELTGLSRGRHEWWVELRPGTIETPTGPQMALELDVEMQRINREYAARRATGRIDAPTVRLVMPGVFRHWQRFHGKWGGHNKIARCRSDRMIADELAHMTRFAAD